AKLFPVFCTSALNNVGIQPLLNAIATYVPSPMDRPFRGVKPSGDVVTQAPTDSGPLLLWVWKTMADPFAGRVTLFRVLTGVLKSDVTVQNLTRDLPERFGHLLV